MDKVNVHAHLRSISSSVSADGLQHVEHIAYLPAHPMTLSLCSLGLRVVVWFLSPLSTQGSNVRQSVVAMQALPAAPRTPCGTQQPLSLPAPSAAPSVAQGSVAGSTQGGGANSKYFSPLNTNKGLMHQLSEMRSSMHYSDNGGDTHSVAASDQHAPRDKNSAMGGGGQVMMGVGRCSLCCASVAWCRFHSLVTASDALGLCMPVCMFMFCTCKESGSALIRSRSCCVHRLQSWLPVLQVLHAQQRPRDFSQHGMRLQQGHSGNTPGAAGAAAWGTAGHNHPQQGSAAGPPQGEGLMQVRCIISHVTHTLLAAWVGLVRLGEAHCCAVEKLGVVDIELQIERSGCCRFYPMCTGQQCVRWRGRSRHPGAAGGQQQHAVSRRAPAARGQQPNAHTPRSSSSTWPAATAIATAAGAAAQQPSQGRGPGFSSSTGQQPSPCTQWQQRPAAPAAGLESGGHHSDRDRG